MNKSKPGFIGILTRYVTSKLLVAAAISAVLYYTIKFVALCFFLKANDKEYGLVYSDTPFFTALSDATVGFQHWFTTFDLIFNRTPSTYAMATSFALAYWLVIKVQKDRFKKFKQRQDPLEKFQEEQAKREADDDRNGKNINALIRAGQPAPDMDVPPGWKRSAEVLANATREMVVFKKLYPVDFSTPTNTFFGGLPLAAGPIDWPQGFSIDGMESTNLPASFLGQIDCADLPDFGLRDLLPKTGFLQFFVSENQGVRYEPALADQCTQVVPPSDLPDYMDDTRDEYKKTWLLEQEFPGQTRNSIYPKWPMKMGVLSDICTLDDLELDTRFFDATMDEVERERYETLQKQRVDQGLDGLFGPEIGRETALSVQNLKPKGMWRPFEGFPHAWIAIETLAGLFSNQLLQSIDILDKRTELFNDGSPLPNTDKLIELEQAQGWAAQAELHQSYLEQAQVWVKKAATNGLGTAPAPADKTAFLNWWEGANTSTGLHIEKRYNKDRRNTPYWANMMMETAMTHAVDACLSFSAKTAALVPADVVATFRHHHSQRKYMHGLHKMFGFPSQIQNAREQFEGTHLMLMEFHYDMGFDWEFGDMGAFQYWITPKDLRLGAFNKAILTFECH